MFCLNTETVVGFVIDDSYLPDNTGGISLLISESTPSDGPLSLWSYVALCLGISLIVRRRLQSMSANS